jgi:CubicO group peptidase (beta-lactamase class C family)
VPLGITDVTWSRLPGNAAPAASSGLRMRPCDLAKLGRLVLPTRAEAGKWRGHQIVPATWIEEATAAQVGPPDRLVYYGYQWWLGRSLLRQRETFWVAAQGLGRQRLFVVPALDLVLVVTAGLYADPMQAWSPLVILNRFVL